MSTLNLDLPVSEKIVTRWNSLTDEERQQWQDALPIDLPRCRIFGGRIIRPPLAYSPRGGASDEPERGPRNRGAKP